MRKIIEIALVLVLTQHPAFGQETIVLSVGKKVFKNMLSKDKHEYLVYLKKGQFALANIAQKKVDVKIATYGPDGNQIEEFDSLNGNMGNELILLDATEDGTYKMEVTPFGKKWKKGQYEIELISIEEDVKDHLNQILQTSNDRGNLPGFAVNVVNKDTLLYQNAKGYAIIENNIPYTPQTVQSIASISKTFIAISLMMLVEEGKLGLDTPINSILPFKVTNPYFPQEAITIRHLATHTSGINDFPIYYTKAGLLTEELPIEKEKYPKEIQKTLKMAMENEDMSMVEFIKKMLTKEGEWYKKKNFFKRPSGQEWFYSNVGAVLAAHIVELVSGTSYDSFVKTRILTPLKLQNTEWDFTKVAAEKLATGYTQTNLPLPRFKLITYPDGGLFMNSKDLTSYLMFLMNGYFGNDNLLKLSSFAEMMKVQFKNPSGDYKGKEVGLFWEISNSGNLGHNGGSTGVISMMYFHPEKKVGYTMLCNMDPTENGNALAEFERVFITMRRYAPSLK